MNSFIEYFYGIKVPRVIYNDKYYSFVYNNFIFKLYPYNDYNSIDFVFDVNRKLIGNTLMSEIIINKDNEVISNYNGDGYVLLKLYSNINKNISLEEISLISNSLYKEKISVNWGMLWGRKIDYLEDLINENGKKYPLIVDSFNYFVGMAENAISYFNSIAIDDNFRYSISHKVIRFNDMVDTLYNPLNIIFDFRVRDVAEYIKISFFNNNYNIFNELFLYLKSNYLSLTEVRLLVSRLLYPSFYFDLYADILIDNKEEKIILDIISRLDEYEVYLNSIFNFLKGYYDIEEIEWLTNKNLDLN